MQHSSDFKPQAEAIARLFEATFSASEGPDEGALIGKLARDLLSDTSDSDLHVFTTWDGSTLAGAIIFSRLHVPDDHRGVFLLAPVAVAPDQQGQGVGQSLLQYGLSEMRRVGADVAVTYGDPAYYGKVGFQPVTTETVPAPRPLQMPEGWLAQSLTDAPLHPIKGPAHCVPAIDDPAYW
ncbi:N-acetyltransferase [Salibaculum sp.]|uniref:GNAT family N-acetyltransferase n=1 Tax=Salibaculum sp. TaxID=2855480 RepID=UPI002B46AA09|nr:N-acetyltransferase [Salibaculum sp.]HKL68944.1 N-acetyltransferase [Salibaculum sp.]